MILLEVLDEGFAAADDNDEFVSSLVCFELIDDDNSSINFHKITILLFKNLSILRKILKNFPLLSI